MSESTAQSGKKDSPEQEAFRQYCKEWLLHNVPPPSPVRLPQSALEIMTREQLDYLCAWQKSAYDAGLIACDYPKEYGGGGRTNCQRVANEEMQKVATPFFPNVIGLGMAAPTIFHHAQEPIKRDLLPLLFSGEEIWCQGFSEPGAGSDLASVQTFAEYDGKKWIINGHKVWTSLAHFASWMIILVRTEKMSKDTSTKETSKHAGLSYFVVPIKSALGQGVTVRPLIKITGETGFNEVIFENLEVDDVYRLDAVGKGWEVAMTTLLHERGAGSLLTPQSGSASGAVDSGAKGGVYSLINLAKTSMRNGKPAAVDPIVRDKIMQVIIRMEGLKQNQRRRAVAALNDHPMRLALQNKLLITEITQDAADIGLEIAGAAASLYLNDDNAPDSAQWPLTYMNSFGGTIAAGTSEVQRNILGERVLGLAKSK